MDELMRSVVDDQADGVTLLRHQHQRIRAEFAAVAESSGPAQAEAFEALRTLLAAHETAEEMVVRPMTRRSIAGGDAIADERIEEERQAKELLAELDGMDVGTEDFATRLETLRLAVLSHAEEEERTEFPRLENEVDAGTLERMGTRIRVVERLAPTHPHPHVNSPTANTVLGPFAAVVDRIRDAFTSAPEMTDDPTRRPEREPGQAPLTSRSALRVTEVEPNAASDEPSSPGGAAGR
jgi:hypothetical protein